MSSSKNVGFWNLKTGNSMLFTYLILHFPFSSSFISLRLFRFLASPAFFNTFGRLQLRCRLINYKKRSSIEAVTGAGLLYGDVCVVAWRGLSIYGIIYCSLTKPDPPPLRQCFFYFFSDITFKVGYFSA